MSAPHFEQVHLQGGTRPTDESQQPVDSPWLRSALEQLSDALHVRLTPELLRRAAAEAESMEALSATMTAQKETVSPELAHSLQAEENWWRKIETDHESLSSGEVAELLGKKSKNRTYASHQRQEGMMLGYKRGNSYRYPKFQFDLRRRTVLPVVPDLLRISREYGLPDEEVVMWLCIPSGYFEEQDEPVHHLHDRETMLEAAEMRFGPSW